MCCLLFFKATHLTPSNLMRLVSCTLESNRTYPVEAWKLLFQKAWTSIDQALESFATMVNPAPQFHQICVSPWEIGLLTKVIFSNPRLATTASHPCQMLLVLLERSELPTSARQSYRVLTLSEAGSIHCVPSWPLHPPTSYSA